MPETIILTRQGPIGRLRLNRPAKLNAQTPQMWRELRELGRELRDDRDLRCLVVGGEGRAFSSGIDLSEITGRDGLAVAAGAGEDRLTALIRQGQEAFSWLVDAPFASIAAMRGYALGAGLQLALACDLRLATDDAVLGLGATRHGLIPDGAVLRLARVVGVGRAKELAILNDEISPAEARATGLVNWVCPAAELDRTLERLVAKIRGASPTAAAHTKRLLHESFHRDPRAMIEEMLRSQSACMASWELDEANRAWRDKREAVFYPPRRAERTS